jgi:condensin complex subunit 3
LLLRTYASHCKAIQDEDKLESVLPVVTAVAYKLEQEHKALSHIIRQLEQQQAAATGEEDEEEEKVVDEKLERELAERTFVVKELLTLSAESDFADEIGRRNMFALIRSCYYFGFVLSLRKLNRLQQTQETWSATLRFQLN